jgi:CheY-like chemotaxis protein
MSCDPSSALSGLRVLVAEDNLVNQKILALALGRFGCSVTLTGDGLEAVTAMEQGPYDLILMDLMMPVMDGYQATRHLRDTGCTLPILVISANAFPSDRAAAMAAGASAFLAKPVAIDRLRLQIEALVGTTPSSVT